MSLWLLYTRRSKLLTQVVTAGGCHLHDGAINGPHMIYSSTAEKRWALVTADLGCKKAMPWGPIFFSVPHITYFLLTGQELGHRTFCTDVSRAGGGAATGAAGTEHPSIFTIASASLVFSSGTELFQLSATADGAVHCKGAKGQPCKDDCYIKPAPIFRDALAVKSTDCFAREPGFNVQHSHGS